MTIYNHNEFYKYYKANSKKSHNGKKIWKRNFLSLLSDYYNAISKVIVYDMYSLYLSHRAGTIEIHKYRTDTTYYAKDGKIRKNRLPVDWPATLALWKEDYGDMPKSEYKQFKDKPLVLLFNDHSDGWQYKWAWDRRSSVMKHQSKYLFSAVRANKRRLAKAVKNFSHLDYAEKYQ